MIEAKTKISIGVLVAFALLMLFAAVTRAQTSINVSPLFTGDDLLDGRKAYAVFSRKHFLSVDKGLVLGSNFNDLLRRQDSITNNRPAFGAHIGNVVFRSSNEQVSRIAARRVIAAMANKHSFGNLAYRQNHRKDMSAFSKVFTRRENAIPVSVSVSDPSPAVARAVNLAPKLESNIFAFSFIGTFPTAILRASSFEGVFVNGEGLITSQAGDNYRLSHFKSPIFDLVKNAESLPRFSVSSYKPLYHTSAPQSCSMRVTGAIANCQGASVLWFTSTPTTSIQHFRLETYAGNYTVGADKRAFLIPSGCGTGGAVRVVEVRTDGSTCSLNYTGNLPHARPCSDCQSVSGAQTTIVSSANFRSATARDSLASIFPDPGVSFTDQFAYATTLPLPTSLGGVTVTIDGQPCGLVAVTPGQINFHLPPTLPDFITEVQATIDSTRSQVGRFFGRPQINPNAPGVFTVNATGTGAAASVWLVVKPNGQQIYYAPGNLQFASGDTIVLILYGTGINESTADLILGNGQTVRAQYCGASWMQGVQQMNFILQPSQLWSGQIGAFVRVSRSGVGWWDSQGFDLRR